VHLLHQAADAVAHHLGGDSVDHVSLSALK
jgi:hypothetical protein